MVSGPFKKFHRLHGSQVGASAMSLALVLSAIVAIATAAWTKETESMVHNTTKMKKSTELRMSNRSALEAVSQLLEGGDGLRVPLPTQVEGFEYSGDAAKRESADAKGNALTEWQWKGPANPRLEVDPGTLTFTSCQGRKLDKREMERIFVNGEDVLCDNQILTEVKLKKVKILSHTPGYFTTDVKVAEDAAKSGHAIVKPEGGNGWEVMGQVRRMIEVEAATKFDSDAIFGTANKRQGKQIETSAAFMDQSDVKSHKCKWIKEWKNGSPIFSDWAEPIIFRPRTADGGRGHIVYSYVSGGKGSRFPKGKGENGINYCGFSNKGQTEGYRGGVHQKQLGKVYGFAADISCDSGTFGTMFYIDNPTSSDCFVDLVPLRGAGVHVGGCFATGTKITMANGGTKNAENIEVGDMVFNPATGKPQKVASTRHGYEGGRLIEVGYQGKSVHVTQNHPFMTKSGLKQARHLTKLDHVRASDGSYHPVTTLKQLAEEPYIWVHNLALESEGGEFEQHAVEANGIMTGDHFMQKMLETKIYAETGKTVKSAEESKPYISSLELAE